MIGHITKNGDKYTGYMKNITDIMMDDYENIKLREYDNETTQN